MRSIIPQEPPAAGAVRGTWRPRGRRPGALASRQDDDKQLGAATSWGPRLLVGRAPSPALRPRWLRLAPVLLLLLSLAAGPSSGSTLTDFDGATFYKAPVGARVRIACNGSHWSDDSVSLVLWFKGTVERHSVPIYTVDARQKPLSSGARHLVADAYKGRARFVAAASPPYLDLAPLEPDDQSEYRCRIDYRSRPRENFLIILFVLVPPKSVQILDANGRSLEQVYGPLSEGSDLTLLCLSKGGRPAPSVLWRRRGRVIDDSYLTLNDWLALRRSGDILAAEPAPLERLASGRLANSINNQTEAPLEALEGVWREWRAWPEFELLDAEAAASADGARQLIGAPAALAKSGAPAPADGLALGQAPRDAAQQPHLLTLPVQESIATSLNVLRLETTPGELAGEPLECEASNLHYDLRTLIKLFAPPSLVAGAPGAELAAPDSVAPPSTLEQQPQQQSRAGARTRLHLLPAGEPWRQLAGAMERALEWTVRAGQWQPGGTDHEGVAAAADESSSVGSAAAVARGAKANASAAGAEAGARPGAPTRAPQQAGRHEAAALIYQQLTRPHQMAVRAAATAAGSSASAASEALVRSRLIALDVYQRPQDVRITGPQRPLSAGQPAELSCAASGSRPGARISWLLNGRLLAANMSRQIDEPRSGNVSLSRLQLTPAPSDHGAQLVCRAHNEALARLLAADRHANASAAALHGGGEHSTSLAGASLEDTRLLAVHYAPKLRLELGTKMLSTSIREGSDIYFACHVDSVPGVKELTWLHNERPLNESASGVITSNNSLVLQKVRLHQKGLYSCLASNSEGLGESNRIELRVLHAPFCVLPSERARHEAAGQEGARADEADALLAGAQWVPLRGQAHFLCRMEAEPASGLQISWYLNNSHAERRLVAGREERDSVESAAASADSRPNRSSALEGGRPASGERAPERRASRLHRLMGAADEPAGAGSSPHSESQSDPQSDSDSSSGAPLEDAHSQAATAGQLNGAPDRPLSPAANRNQGDSQARDRNHNHHRHYNRHNNYKQSQLTYQVDSPLDYGRLYCVARNSIGEQKRACVFEVRPPPDAAAQPVGASDRDRRFSCLTANVTSRSAWVACPQESLLANRRAGDESLEAGPAGPRQRFSLQLYSSATSTTSAQQSGEPADAGSLAGTSRLEANLSTPPLEEALFALAELRPRSVYLLRVQSERGRSGSVRFSTLDESTDGAESLPTTATTSRHEHAPRIEPLVAAHRPALLSALISTRSTHAESMGEGAHEAAQLATTYQQQSQNQQHLAPGSPAPAKSPFLSSILQLFQPILGSGGPLKEAAARRAHTPSQQQQQQASNQLMESAPHSGGLLAVLGLCLAGAGWLALVLLLLHARRSSGPCALSALVGRGRRRQRGGRGHGCGPSTKPAPSGGGGGAAKRRRSKPAPSSDESTTAPASPDAPAAGPARAHKALGVSFSLADAKPCGIMQGARHDNDLALAAPTRRHADTSVDAPGSRGLSTPSPAALGARRPAERQWRESPAELLIRDHTSGRLAADDELEDESHAAARLAASNAAVVFKQQQQQPAGSSLALFQLSQVAGHGAGPGSPRRAGSYQQLNNAGALASHFGPLMSGGGTLDSRSMRMASVSSRRAAAAAAAASACSGLPAAAARAAYLIGQQRASDFRAATLASDADAGAHIPSSSSSAIDYGGSQARNIVHFADSPDSQQLAGPALISIANDHQGLLHAPDHLAAKGSARGQFVADSNKKNANGNGNNYAHDGDHGDRRDEDDEDQDEGERGYRAGEDEGAGDEEDEENIDAIYQRQQHRFGVQDGSGRMVQPSATSLHLCGLLNSGDSSAYGSNSTASASAGQQAFVGANMNAPAPCLIGSGDALNSICDLAHKHSQAGREFLVHRSGGHGELADGRQQPVKQNGDHFHEGKQSHLAALDPAPSHVLTGQLEQLHQRHIGPSASTTLYNQHSSELTAADHHQFGAAQNDPDDDQGHQHGACASRELHHNQPNSLIIGDDFNRLSNTPTNPSLLASYGARCAWPPIFALSQVDATDLTGANLNQMHYIELIESSNGDDQLGCPESLSASGLITTGTMSSSGTLCHEYSRQFEASGHSMQPAGAASLSLSGASGLELSFQTGSAGSQVNSSELVCHSNASCKLPVGHLCLSLGSSTISSSSVKDQAISSPISSSTASQTTPSNAPSDSCDQHEKSNGTIKRNQAANNQPPLCSCVPKKDAIKGSKL